MGTDGEQNLTSRLRLAILSLEFAPGEPISERTLEQHFKISRTPIREALFHLMRDGLVIRDGRSYAVAPFDMAEITESFDFRDIVEPEATRLAVQHATDAEIEAIRGTLHAASDISATQSWLDMVLDFHLRCARLSRNRFLTNAMQDVTMRSLRARWLNFSSQGGQHRTLRDHEEILDFLAARDAEGAARAVRAHSARMRIEVMDAIRGARRFMGRRGVVGE